MRSYEEIKSLSETFLLPSGRFINIPYNRQIPKTLERALESINGETILFMPCRTDTRWFRSLNKYPRCQICGRVIMPGYTNGAPFPSMLVYIGNRINDFVELCDPDIGEVYGPAFEHLSPKQQEEFIKFGCLK